MPRLKKNPQRCGASLPTAVHGASPLPLKPLAQIEHCKRDACGDRGELPDGGVLAELDVLIDGDREGGGLAGDISRDHDGGSEFTQRAGEGEQATC